MIRIIFFKQNHWESTCFNHNHWISLGYGLNLRTCGEGAALPTCRAQEDHGTRLAVEGGRVSAAADRLGEAAGAHGLRVRGGLQATWRMIRGSCQG